MLNISITIILTTSLFVAFKLFHLFKLDTFLCIIINYLICVVTGIVFTGLSPISKANIEIMWIIPAFVTGSLFVITFYLMSLTVEKVNMTVAGVANKLSLIIPVTVGSLIIDSQIKNYSTYNYIGIILGLGAIVLSSIRPKDLTNIDKSDKLTLILPSSIFILGGVIDLLINYVNYKYLDEQSRTLFPIAAFIAAFIAGMILIGIRTRKVKLHWKEIAGGIGLGIPNYFSVYFLLRALEDFNNDSAIFFPVLNIGIIVMTGLTAIVLFKEKLSNINLAGMFLSILALTLILI